MYHSKKIGVFISHIYGPFQSELCQGIIDKASSYGYLVEIFSSNDGENFGNNRVGENSILRIPNFEKYSGIIFASGTYPVPDLKKQIYEKLKKHCTCPVIEVNQVNAMFPAVVLDNDSTIVEIIEHLILIHNYKRICYLGNSIETYFSFNRYNYYVNTMKKHNMSLSQHDYYCCGYSDEEIDKSIDFFFSEDKKPDAIICYNDRMALTLMLSLIKRGYHVPNDIAVTGFDTLEFGQNFNPTLTSVTFPIKELGYSAVEKLLKLINGETVPFITYVKAELSVGGSCGCPNYIKDKPLYYSHQLLTQINTMEQFMIEDINMSSTLHGVTDLDEGIDLLAKYVRMIDNCKEFYLCLYSNWDSLSSHIRKITYTEDEEKDTDTILLKLAIKDGKRLHECSFSSQDSLPDYIYSQSNSAYIYSPLFFNELEFGYVVLSYKDNRLSYRFNFTLWLMNVNNMLKHICDTKQMGLLVNRLETLYQKDDLTGHLTSYSFHHMAGQMVAKAQENMKTVMAIVFDLDGVRAILEDFGYEELNFAIQVVGHAVENAMNENFLCARMEGSRFYILACGYDNDTAIEFIGKVQNYIKNYNRLQTKKYIISVSCGYSIKKADKTFYLQELIEDAEKNLYKEKEKKSVNELPQN